jgi:molecular chaperone IbpA
VNESHYISNALEGYGSKVILAYRRNKMTNLQVRSIDIPQLHRFGVGFDRMFDHFEEAVRANQTNYPPFNIIKTDENNWLIELAVAGFKQGDINITVKQQQLTIEGKQTGNDHYDYVHRGLSSRDFVRSWTLADHVEVRDATQENGILSIHLERVIPEESRPKSIAITYVK